MPGRRIIFFAVAPKNVFTWKVAQILSESCLLFPQCDCTLAFIWC